MSKRTVGVMYAVVLGLFLLMTVNASGMDSPFVNDNANWIRNTLDDQVVSDAPFGAIFAYTFRHDDTATSIRIPRVVLPVPPPLSCVSSRGL